MTRTILTQERLREIFEYDPQTGLFKRIKNGRGRHARTGVIANYDNGQGYIVITIDRRPYKAHRLAFLYMTGSWPKNEVDHINGVRSDNRWENLRDVTNKENIHNQRSPHRNNSTGFLGVKPYGKKFGASISVDGVREHLGLFDTPESAHAAYVEAKRRLHRSCTI